MRLTKRQLRKTIRRVLEEGGIGSGESQGKKFYYYLKDVDSKSDYDGLDLEESDDDIDVFLASKGDIDNKLRDDLDGTVYEERENEKSMRKVSELLQGDIGTEPKKMKRKDFYKAIGGMGSDGPFAYVNESKKITKRQLKRIIREEYSRLKRRGLIREMYDDNAEFDNYDACVQKCLAAIPPMMKKMCGMGMSHMVTNDIYHLCVPICEKMGCDPDMVSEQVEEMLCN